MPEARRVHVGVAGWSYPDWRDTVYRLPAGPVPADLFGGAASRPATYPRDELVFLAGYVDMIEIDNPFYRIPTVRTVDSWAKRVAGLADFFFTAKLNHEFTHEFHLSKPLAAEYRAALRPLTDAARLRGLLAQFRYDFADTPDARTVLRWIHQEFAGFAPLIVEVRHKSWEAPAATGFFQDLGVVVANLDYPTANDSFNPYKCTLGGSGYLRLHGRNRQAWFSRDASPAETYNYDYSEAEIAELAKRSRDLLGDVRELTIVANNHYQGKAVSAALRLKSELTQQQVPVPPALLETYPILKKILATDAGGGAGPTAG